MDSTNHDLSLARLQKILTQEYLLASNVLMVLLKIRFRQI
jgi:hypothetical protein